MSGGQLHDAIAARARAIAATFPEFGPRTLDALEKLLSGSRADAHMSTQLPGDFSQRTGARRTRRQVRVSTLNVNRSFTTSEANPQDCSHATVGQTGGEGDPSVRAAAMGRRPTSTAGAEGAAGGTHNTPRTGTAP